MDPICDWITKTVFLIFTIMISEIANYSSRAKIEHRDLLTHENWKFVTQWCFINSKSSHGEFVYDVRYDETYAVQKILMYYGEQFTGENSSLTSCRQKESVLKVIIGS